MEWKLVPVEPTEEMVANAVGTMILPPEGCDQVAMLSASPSPEGVPPEWQDAANRAADRLVTEIERKVGPSPEGEGVAWRYRRPEIEEDDDGSIAIVCTRLDGEALTTVTVFPGSVIVTDVERGKPPANMRLERRASPSLEGEAVAWRCRGCDALKREPAGRCCPDRFHEPLFTTPVLPAGEAVREKVARIIEPDEDLWIEAPTNFPRVVRQRIESRRRNAFSKADAIISLLGKGGR